MEERLYKVIIVYDDKEIADINNITPTQLDEFMDCYNSGKLYWYGDEDKKDKSFSVNKERVKMLHAIKLDKRIEEVQPKDVGDDGKDKKDQKSACNVSP